MKHLYDKESSVEFYDARYEEGYMEEWDEAKKSKVIEIIKDLPLPQKGTALDFGCGNGVFVAAGANALTSIGVTAGLGISMAAQ